MTQTDLSTAAQVSRRWLSDLEGGKPTAEIGLIFKVLHALAVTVEATPTEEGPGYVDLEEILRSSGQRDTEGPHSG